MQVACTFSWPQGTCLVYLVVNPTVLLCSSDLLFVKFPRFMAVLVGLFFGYIQFHARPCCRHANAGLAFPERGALSLKNVSTPAKS